MRPAPADKNTATDAGARRGPDQHSGDIMVQFPVQTGGA